jgi:hypothetical protein
MKVHLYWRQERRAQTTQAPPSRRRRTRQCRQEEEGSAAHLASTSEAYLQSVAVRRRPRTATVTPPAPPTGTGRAESSQPQLQPPPCTCTTHVGRHRHRRHTSAATVVGEIRYGHSRYRRLLRPPPHTKACLHRTAMRSNQGASRSGDESRRRCRGCPRRRAVHRGLGRSWPPRSAGEEERSHAATFPTGRTDFRRPAQVAARREKGREGGAAVARVRSPHRLRKSDAGSLLCKTARCNKLARVHTLFSCRATASHSTRSLQYYCTAVSEAN